MLGKRKHSMINDSLEHELVRQVITEQIDLDIALKRRLLAAAEARVEWAEILRDLLLEEQTESDLLYQQSSFHDVAERAYGDIEDSCHIISSHRSGLLRPITTGKPPVFQISPIIEAPRTRKRITLSLTNTPSQSGPILYQDRNTGTTVKLTCLDCGRSDFPTMQGFVNHCRLAHSRIFNTHDDCIRASGIPISNDEEKTFRLAGVEVHTSNWTSVRGLFELAVGSGNTPVQSDVNGSMESVSTHLSRTLGVHALTPTLAPFLGKAVHKKQIHVFDEPNLIDIMSSDEKESRKSALCQRLKQRREDKDKASFVIDVLSLSAIQQDDMLDSSTPTQREPLDSEHSRFRVKRRVIVADHSLYLPEGKRPSDLSSHTHRWQLSVDTPSYGHDITTFLDRFTVTCLTQPPVFSQPIHVFRPPFISCSTTDKPFLARLKLYWVGEQNHALEVDHWVELDSSCQSRPVLGEEQMFDVELDRDTPFRNTQNTDSIVPWTGESDHQEASPISVHDGPSLLFPKSDLIEHSPDYQHVIRSLAARFPMISSGAASSFSLLPYAPARSLTKLFDLPMGVRKARELSRARTIRREFESMRQNFPELSKSEAKLSAVDVFRWLDSNGLYPRPPHFVQTPLSSEETVHSEAKAPDPPKFCSVCGVNLRCHSAMVANHYRSANGQCSAELELHRAPIIHVYTLLAPSTIPGTPLNPLQVTFAYKPRDILSIAHPHLLLLARQQTESLSLTCFPRFPLNSSPLKLANTADETALILAPYGLLAVVTKFVLRDIVNGAVQVARDIQTRTKVARTDSISDRQLFSLLTPTHVLESLMIKDGTEAGKKDVFSKCYSRLGTLLQVDTTLSCEKDNYNNTTT